jgi:hypothetical protein
MLAAVSMATAAAVTPVLGGSKTGAFGSSDSDRTFDPTRHGFGFYNWRVQDGPYPEIERPAVETDWRDSFEAVFDRPIAELPDGFLDKLTHHARAGLLEAVRTNGYCYGLVFAAKKYFERPETIPGGFDTAGEIMDPNAPLDSEKTPILDEIIEYHAAQYLDFQAWLGRYGVFHPSAIDYETQLRDLTAAIDAFGTAGVTLISEESVRSHQVLLTGYDRHATGITFAGYDPNYTAETYHTFDYTIEVDTTGETPKPEPIEYGVRYEQFLHNEYDREILSRRNSAGSVFDDSSRLYDGLFGTTLFVTTDRELDVVVVDPSGRRLERTIGDDTVCYRYGAVDGTYTITLTGQRSKEYALDIYASSAHHTILDETAEGSVSPGELLQYEVTIDRNRASLETGLGSAASLGVIGGYAYHHRS